MMIVFHFLYSISSKIASLTLTIISISVNFLYLTYDNNIVIYVIAIADNVVA